MKICFLSITILAVLIPAACIPSLASEKSAEAAMTADPLPPCPSSPNCVCSEYPDRGAYAPPLAFTETSEAAWQRAIKTVQEMGGTIVRDTGHYLHATFTSRVFKFVDDLELRLAEKHKTIHLRSASRTGYWDFRVNRRRAERLRDRFSEEP